MSTEPHFPTHQDGALRMSRAAWRARGYWLRGFARFTAHRYLQDRCQAVAANLTLTTLLALVPIMTLIFKVLELMPVIKRTQRTVQDFLFEHFIPAASISAKSYLLDFVKSASKLNAIGIVILIVTALLLVNTIDRAFNAIWGASMRRRFGRKLVLYWAMLTLAPLLMGASIAISSYLFSLPYMREVADVKASLIEFLPFLLTLLGLMVLYAWLPNRPVRPCHAFAGALLATLLFEVAKIVFGKLIAAFPNYQAVYGAMAALPVLVLWVYLSWTIVLIGAEVCHALGVFKLRRGGVRDPFLLAVQMLDGIWEAQRARSPLTVEKTLGECGAENGGEVLTVLEQLGLVGRVRDNELCLGVDAHSLKLCEVYAQTPWRLPTPEAAAHELGSAHAVVQQLARARTALEESLAVSLHDVLHSSP